MKAISFVLLIVLAGCQTSQPAQPPIPPDPGQACLTNLAYRSEFSIIADKLALVGLSQQTFGMLSNTSKPNAAEKTAIAEWVKAKQGCFEMMREWRRQYNFPPTLAVIQDTNISTFLNLTADLYNRKLTYGEYAKARADIGAQADQQWAQAIQHLREQQAADDEQRRNRAMQYQLNQQRAAQLYTPVVPYQRPTRETTDCYFIGKTCPCPTQGPRGVHPSIFNSCRLPRPPIIDE